MVPIDGFDKNVRIVHVGDLFKKIGTKDWKINVFGSPIQNKKYTRFANLWDENKVSSLQIKYHP